MKEWLVKEVTMDNLAAGLNDSSTQGWIIEYLFKTDQIGLFTIYFQIIASKVKQ